MYAIINEPWPWYVTGPLFGLSIPLLLFFGNKMLGVSSALRHICAVVLVKSEAMSWFRVQEMFRFHLFSTLLGIFVYGLIRHKLPH